MKALWGKNTTTETLLEKFLEKIGAVRALQTWREAVSTEHEKQEIAFTEILSTEMFMQSVVQRETSCLNELAVTDDDSIRQQIEAELEGLQETYWIQERYWHWLRTALVPPNAMSRGFNLWRSHPRWYLHRALRQDCAMRGGCCGRTCGCCLKVPRSNRALGAGHCTLDCDCCEKARGFELTDVAHDWTQQFFRHYYFGEDAFPYYRKLALALILGLEKGSPKNPFELIDERIQFTPRVSRLTAPPKYD